MSTTAPKASLTRPISSFLCTVCWKFQYPPACPKLLDSSSRIVCAPCYNAILDLSICWRCGECVVRGEDVVSLGWCFWHRACFGCLVCGSYMNLDRFLNEIRTESLPSPSGSNLSSNSSLHDIREEGHSGLRGVELECIPLCDWCRVETEGRPEEQVLEEGLKTVTSFDGGLSRSRHDKMTKDAPTSAHKTREAPRLLSRSPQQARSPMRSGRRRSLFPLSKRKSRELDLHPEGRSEHLGLLGNAAIARISEDGSNDSDARYIEEPLSDDPSHVYVSILDPVAKATFVPGIAKPLPKWMAMLPNNVRREDEDDLNQKTMNKSSYALGLHPPNKHDCEHHGLSAPKVDSNRAPKISTATRTEKRGRASTMFQTIDLKRRKGKRRSSDMSVSTYKTAPEFPPAQILAPYSSPRPSETRKSSYKPRSSYFHDEAHKALELHDNPQCNEFCCELAKRPPRPDIHELERLDSTLHMSKTLPTSSEYLERYRPEKPAIKHPTYVAKEAESVLDRIKRQREKIRNLDDGSEESNRKKAAMMKVIQEEFGIDPRREDLNKQLKTLFGEE
ncbi:mediator of rna polymerase ii transcription [Phlyctema vagabunda]|uniref:Mediator of rna polymerase ii transcription n=1 Tax=Phlyctema vagabunda TaxID=108571 RepID=A0ABR4PTR9_9HELO